MPPSAAAKLTKLTAVVVYDHPTRCRFHPTLISFDSFDFIAREQTTTSSSPNRAQRTRAVKFIITKSPGLAVKRFSGSNQEVNRVLVDSAEIGLLSKSCISEYVVNVNIL
ncbi:hypothetical protein Dimus_023266 [Dionaea muscipula]